MASIVSAHVSNVRDASTDMQDDHAKRDALVEVTPPLQVSGTTCMNCDMGSLWL